MTSYTAHKLAWRPLSGTLPPDTEAFVVGDVHGQADLLFEVLCIIKNTPRYARTRLLVFLGDLIDRGPASIRAVDLAMRGVELAGADDVCVLPGNHDLHLLHMMSEERWLEKWLASGGHTVLAEIGVSDKTHSWVEITEQLQKALHPEYLTALETGPTHLYIGDLLCVHAGVHPYGDIRAFLDQSRYCIMIDDHWSGIRYPFLSFTEGWDSDDPDLDRRQRRPTVIAHGHTPALRRPLICAADLEICDGVETHRTIALDIGAAYRPQLAWAHVRTRAQMAEVQINAVAEAAI